MFLNIAKSGRNNLLLYLVMTLLVFMAYFLAQLLIPAVGYYTAVIQNGVSPDAFYTAIDTFDLETLHIGKNLFIIMLLSMFIASFLVMYFAFPRLHNRKFLTLITPKSSVNYRKIFIAFGLWILLGLVAETIMYALNPDIYITTFKLSSFLPLLLIAIILLPIQTSFEELFFRGYLLQGFSLIGITIGENNQILRKLMPLMLTSILFALVHGSNPETAKYGTSIMMANYFGAGLFLGILVLLDDGLELALGVHWATNFYAACLVGYSGSALDTDAIFKMTTIDPYHMLLVLIISGIVFVLICYKLFKLKSITSIWS